MNITIAPFDRDRHLAAAAALLAERHRRDRSREPLLPAAFEEPAANISGARFWQSNGFQPVEYRMRRRIDERIAWANE